MKNFINLTKTENVKLITKNKQKYHPFHLLEPSWLPFVTAFSAFSVLTNLVFYWHYGINLCPYQSTAIMASLLIFLSILFYWFCAVIYESATHHTFKVSQGLRYGFILFIASEIFFFFAFFWGYFHFSLTSSISLGYQWPPMGTQEFDIFGLPLVNTLLLLSSGVTITIAHHIIVLKRPTIYFGLFQIFLMLTIIFGVAFLICQGIEYTNGLNFRWNDNVFGSCFFILTGFHGFHVTVGTIYLLVCWFRTEVSLYAQNLLANQTKQNFINFFNASFLTKIAESNFTRKQHVGFETAAWYWHFVDVVWLFLFVSVYWWGGLILNRNINDSIFESMI